MYYRGMTSSLKSILNTNQILVVQLSHYKGCLAAASTKTCVHIFIQRQMMSLVKRTIQTNFQGRFIGLHYMINDIFTEVNYIFCVFRGAT